MRPVRIPMSRSTLYTLQIIGLLLLAAPFAYFWVLIVREVMR